MTIPALTSCMAVRIVAIEERGFILWVSGVVVEESMFGRVDSRKRCPSKFVVSTEESLQNRKA